jgi:hypothetical protein
MFNQLHERGYFVFVEGGGGDTHCAGLKGVAVEEGRGATRTEETREFTWGGVETGDFGFAGCDFEECGRDGRPCLEERGGRVTARITITMQRSPLYHTTRHRLWRETRLQHPFSQLELSLGFLHRILDISAKTRPMKWWNLHLFQTFFEYEL